MTKHIEPKDIDVGRLIRVQRVAVGLSQTALGDAVGVTFQQIQKYEKGVNRVGASRLHKMAQVLKVEPGYFFGSGKPNGKHESNISSDTLRLMADVSAVKLVRDYAKMNPGRQQAVRRLVAALVDSDEDEE